jgi:fatty-acyl-CoA synthase
MFTPLTPIRCLYRAVDLYGPKEAVVCGEHRFTYAQFGERCERLAAALQASGVGGRDRVAYLSFNTHKLLEGYFGVVMAGAIVMPLNVRLSPAELIEILQHSGARVLFFEDEFSGLIPSIRAACPKLETVISLEHGYEPFLASADPVRIDYYNVAENSVAELFYTSGSTGTPKGVMLSHRTLYLHALSVSSVFAPDDTGIQLHTIPLFHANGWGCPQATTLMGAKHVMVRRFDPATVFRLIETERATGMLLVPTMANALLNSPGITKTDFSSLKEIYFGGAASTPDLISRMEKAFGCACNAGYGLTETAPVLTNARPKGTLPAMNDADRYTRLAMAGWPIIGVELRVVDGNMNDVPRDFSSIGEVVARGDHLMEGYFDDDAGTQAVMTNGWFHTGDMAVWDTETYIHIVDRRKDIIISGGENISSLEVEKAIGLHPDVLECAVVAAPDPKWGEIPVAFVSLKTGATLDAAQLFHHLGPLLARFKMPRQFEFVTEPLPKTGTGKILKRELRERFWTGRDLRVQG